MIVVIVDQTGDSAEAEDPAAAVTAATTLCKEAWEAQGGAFPVTASFYLAGAPVALRVPEASLWAALEPCS